MRVIECKRSTGVHIDVTDRSEQGGQSDKIFMFGVLLGMPLTPHKVADLIATILQGIYLQGELR